jgi:hypothetical protein
MALIVKDRVRETTTTTGTGTLTLLGTVSGFQAFSAIGGGNQTYYTIVDAATGAFEVGIGTYTASGTTLSRDTVLESSNANALVSFSSGTKDVFVTYPADRSVSQADIGTEPNEIPLNQYLGSMAYQDLNSVTIDGGVATLDTATITSIQNDTAISNVEPSLMLNFAAVKKLDPRITFARASTGAYYDGQTVAKAEENLLLQSQTLKITPWSNSISGTGVVPVVTANDGVAPDGTTTAERIQFSLNGGTASGDISRWRQSVATTSGLPYVLSFYLKSYDGVSTYDIHLVGADGATGSTITVTGTWTRFTVTANGTGGSVLFALGLRGAQSPANSDTADLLVWGAQLEQRSSVTAYTPTTTQPITNYIPALQTAASGVARFDHDPVTTESLGLLIEEQRTNLLTYSEDFTDGSWVKSNTTITSNTITAPDSTLTGDKIVETSGAGVRQLYKTPSLSAVSHSFSAYFKASERYWFKLNLTGSGAYFDLSTGVIGTIDAGVTAAMTAVGNGWYRCSIVRTVSAGTNYTEIQLALTNGGGSYTGDGYSGIYIWGAQLEAGAFPTSYIPTVASQVTRAADSASMTGTNFSDWYRPDEGTLYGEYVSGESQGTQAVAYIGDNTVNNRIVVYDDGTVGVGSDGYIIVASSGVTQALINLGTSSRNQKHKIIGAYKTNDFAGSFDGGSSSVDTLGIVPLGLDRLILADAGGVASKLNGHLRKFAYYPARLSNEELQEMTS